MSPPKRHDDEFEVDEPLVRALLRAQFPRWTSLPLRLVELQGTDHTIYRLGDELVVRMPIMEYCTHQAVKEARWVPFLAPQVPLELPMPVAMGAPGEGYPWAWSIVRWIEGERATRENLAPEAAIDLARFIRALQACDPTGGPPAGASTGGRGVSLSLWVERVAPWIAKLDDTPFIRAALEVWADALAAPEWDRPATWFHGDLSGNLIARDGRLVGAIDSGYGIGDPACDLMPGWTLFRGATRRAFFDEVALDEATIRRSRAFAVGPALIGMSYYRDVPHLRANATGAIEGVLAD
jgi:aminoglycoside phosphotransferase (APT) family kinase protein